MKQKSIPARGDGPEQQGSRRNALASATLVLLGAVLAGSCSKGGDGRADAAAAVSAVPVVETTGPCAQRRLCCTALTQMPGIEGARQLCRMHQMEDAMGRQLTRDGGTYDEVCQKELVQLQGVWRLHSLAKSDAEMPAACRSSPPAGAPPAP